MEAKNKAGKNPAGAQSRGAEGGTNLSGKLCVTEPVIKNARLAKDLADIKAMPLAERRALAELCSL